MVCVMYGIAHFSIYSQIYFSLSIVHIQLISLFNVMFLIDYEFGPHHVPLLDFYQLLNICL